MENAESVTVTGIEKFIQWARLAKKSWRRPETEFFGPPKSSEEIDEESSPSEPKRCSIGVEWIEAAKEIWDLPLWSEPLPRFNPWRRIEVHKYSLEELSELGKKVFPADDLPSRIKGMFEERFCQYEALQNIRRSLRKIAVSGIPQDSYIKKVQLSIPHFLSVKVNSQEGESQFRNKIPRIYKDFFAALEQCDASRIRLCLGCKRLFWAARKQRRTCSNKCRMRLSRHADQTPRRQTDRHNDSTGDQTVKGSPKRRTQL